MPRCLPARAINFTLGEGVDVARNHYAPDGTFLGVVQAPSDTAAALAALAETAWALALFDTLASSAIYDDEARTLLADIAARYRRR